MSQDKKISVEKTTDPDPNFALIKDEWYNKMYNKKEFFQSKLDEISGSQTQFLSYEYKYANSRADDNKREIRLYLFQDKNVSDILMDDDKRQYAAFGETLSLRYYESFLYDKSKSKIGFLQMMQLEAYPILKL